MRKWTPHEEFLVMSALHVSRHNIVEHLQSVLPDRTWAAIQAKARRMSTDIKLNQGGKPVNA